MGESSSHGLLEDVRESFTRLLVLGRAHGISVSERSSEDVLGASREFLERLPEEVTVGDVRTILDDAEREDRWGQPVLLRSIIAGHVNRAMRSDDAHELVMAAIWCLIAGSLTYRFAAWNLLADACKRLAASDTVVSQTGDYLTSHGSNGWKQLVEWRLGQDRIALRGSGWLLESGPDGTSYAWNPLEALDDFVTSPEPDEEPGIEALDVDTSEFSIRELPIPCGWDIRIALYVGTLKTATDVLEACASMDGTRQSSAGMFAFRRAEWAVRSADPTLLHIALLAACLPPSFTFGYDPAVISIYAVLLAAERIASVANVVKQVHPLLDSERQIRLRTIAEAPAGLRAASGLVESEGPDGYTLLAAM